jgi:hypothetical protein
MDAGSDAQLPLLPRATLPPAPGIAFARRFSSNQLDESRDHSMRQGD